MTDSFIQKGYEIVPFSGDADIYVVNTCTVTAVADKKSRQMLRRAKKTNPDSLVVAAGCFSDDKGASRNELKEVDLFIGNEDKNRIVELVEEASGIRSLQSDAAEEKDDAHVYHLNTRAFLKIQDGCDQFCSYCIIPYVRGRIKSRNKEDIIREVKALDKNGVKEIVLTGIHICSYGLDKVDKTYNNEPENPLFSDLIASICKETDVKRLRLGSLEPRCITEDFCLKLKELEPLCHQFHLSLQSGCDSTLKRMNRHYSTDDYKRAVDLLRKHFRDPAITTDIITGFPGETDEEFEETKAFAEGIGFSRVHIFKYSRRPGTKADLMDDQVPEDKKTERSNALFEISRDGSRKYIERHLGETVSVLTEQEEEGEGGSYYTGYTKEYIPVRVYGSDLAANSILEGILKDKKDKGEISIVADFGKYAENAQD